MKYLSVRFLLLCSLCCTSGYAQHGWFWEQLPDMPEPVANNAVSGALSNDTMCVYSFCGIDQTLAPSGIHLRTFKYNTISQEWSQLEDVPDLQGKIAPAANFCNGIIYVSGGYTVEANFSEATSPKMSRFDPDINGWLTDAPDIPVPTDDHVQTVYKDSLVYLITGWSDNSNIDEVQVYNTYDSTWYQATPVPNNSAYTAFGASGGIVGDTIYYAGGVRSSGSFVANQRMRKGVMQDSALDIEWDLIEEAPGDPIYRSAVLTYGDDLFWLGGAGVAYNFDGIAYNGSGAVSPVPRILRFIPGSETWIQGTESPFAIMDLRGAAQVSDNEWIICGGMEEGPIVTAKTFLLRFDPLLQTNELNRDTHCLEWKRDGDKLRFSSSCGQVIDEVRLFDRMGRLILQGKEASLTWNKIPQEITILQVFDDSGVPIARIPFFHQYE